MDNVLEEFSVTLERNDVGGDNRYSLIVRYNGAGIIQAYDVT
jgi:hypothetical protein